MSKATMTAPTPMPALAPIVRPDEDGWGKDVNDGDCGRGVARSVDVMLLLHEGDKVVDKVDGGWDVNVLSGKRPTTELVLGCWGTWQVDLGISMRKVTIPPIASRLAVSKLKTAIPLMPWGIHL